MRRRLALLLSAVKAAFGYGQKATPPKTNVQLPELLGHYEPLHGIIRRHIGDVKLTVHTTSVVKQTGGLYVYKFCYEARGVLPVRIEWRSKIESGFGDLPSFLNRDGRSGQVVIRSSILPPRKEDIFMHIYTMREGRQRFVGSDKVPAYVPQ